MPQASILDPAQKRIAPLQATLGFAVWALMSEADYALAGLRPALGRLANAMVAVLGPELQLGSSTYNLCTSVIREMQVQLLCRNLHATAYHGRWAASATMSSRNQSICSDAAQHGHVN